MDLGLHVTTGSRNGYGQTAPRAAVCVSLVGGAYDEVGENCYRVYRPREVYLNGPPEWDTTAVEGMPALADQWWPHLLARVQEIEAAHGPVGALQLTNEMVGNNAGNARKLVAYEGRLMDHAEAAGYTLCVGNLSANSPHWGDGLWQEVLAPFIREAWVRGHVYSRHVYFDISPLADNWQRSFWEVDYLREQGPTGSIVLTELGFVNYPGADNLIAALREYREATVSYPEIGLGAIFTYGDWSGGEGNANIEQASSQLAEYLQAPDEKWQPQTVEPEPEEPMGATAITVSHHQGVMDWPAAKAAGADVALIRMSIGNTKDSRADENFVGATEAGILRQPFHYLLLGDGDPPWHVQARLFYAWLQQLDPPPELPPVIDVEDEGATGNVFNKIRIFAALFYGLARESAKLSGLLPPEIYTAAWWWNPRVGAKAWWQKQYPLHAAHFGVDEPTLPVGWNTYRWHQYDCSADGPAWGATEDDICLSRFNGTREEFELAYGLREPEPAPEPEPEPAERQGYLNRDWNLRRWPELGADSLMLTAHAGMPVTVIGDVEGEEYDGSTKWYELRTLAHSAGVTLDGPDPLDGLQLSPPFRVPFRITSRFNALRNYGNGLHEGLDLDVIGTNPDSKEPVLCMLPGVVTISTTTSKGYGQYVVVESEHNGSAVRIWYAHLDARFVTAGQQVAAGDELGEIGATGNVTGEHVHITLEVPGYGLGGYVVPDVVDPEPYVPAEPAAIDLLPYFLGTHGRSIELHYTWGPGTHPLQVQHGDGVFWYVKGDNGEFEELWAGDQHIYRGIDTSEAHDKYYVQYTPLPDRLAYGARWCPRYMRLGETAEFSPYVIHYWQADCGERGIQGQPLNRISLLDVHGSYTFPSGITLDNVIELGWEGHERYWFAVEYGLVGWEGEGVGQSYISQVHESRPLVRQVPGCWQTPERYRG